MKIIKEAIGSQHTIITIGNNLDNDIFNTLKQSDKSNLFIVSKSVLPRFKNLIDRLSVKEPIILSSQEHIKSIETYTKTIRICFEHSLNRSSRIIAIGGGNIGDFAGFVASTYRRGIDFVYIPTTLLSQCDTVLNKVAIDVGGTKNLIGEFYTPSHIFCDISALKTLSKFSIDCGMSEIVKHSLIRKSKLSVLLNNYLDKKISREDYDWEELIYESIKVKLSLVQDDYFDRKGILTGLNYGHTFAHAFEDYSTRLFPHGLAVALGMKLAGDISYVLNILSENEHDYHDRLLGLTQLSLIIPRELEIERYVQLLKRDKWEDQKISLILLNSIGSYLFYPNVDKSLIKDIISKSKGR